MIFFLHQSTSMNWQIGMAECTLPKRFWHTNKVVVSAFHLTLICSLYSACHQIQTVTHCSSLITYMIMLVLESFVDKSNEWSKKERKNSLKTTFAYSFWRHFVCTVDLGSWKTCVTLLIIFELLQFWRRLWLRVPWRWCYLLNIWSRSKGNNSNCISIPCTIKAIHVYTLIQIVTNMYTQYIVVTSSSFQDKLPLNALSPQIVFSYVLALSIGAIKAG